MPRPTFLLCVALASGWLISAAPASVAQQPAQVLNREFEIKAGYFAYFGSLISWPKAPFAGANQEFVIGILGSNPFAVNLPAIGNGYAIRAGRVNANKIQGKQISVVHYRSVSEFQRNYRPCHVLFISRSADVGVGAETTQMRATAALAKTAGQPVLLVADASTRNESVRLASAGITICYWNDLQSRQVKMFINRKAEKQARLAIRAKLLGLQIVTVL